MFAVALLSISLLAAPGQADASARDTGYPRVQESRSLDPETEKLLTSQDTAIFSDGLMEARQILERCRDISWKMELYGRRPGNRYSSDLHELTGQVTNLLEPLAAKLRQLAAYIDWYPQDDWEIRFERTGYYSKIHDFSRHFQFLHMQSCYYAGLAGLYENDQGASRETRLGNLKDAAQQLLHWTEEAADPAEGRHMQLWLIRLLRVLSEYDASYRSGARTYCQSALNAAGDSDIAGDMLLEDFQLQMNSSDIHTVELLGRRNRLQDWFATHTDDAGLLAQRRLSLQMFYAQTRLAKQKGVSDFRLDNASLVELQTQFEQQPALRAFIAELVAGPLVGEKTATVQSLTAFEIVCLIELHRRAPLNDYQQVRHYADLFTEKFQDKDNYSPLVWYLQGWCGYQLYQQKADANDALLAEILQQWLHLAETFPAWSYEEESVKINSAWVLEQTAALGFAFFLRDPNEHFALTEKILVALTGEKTGTGSFAGPFSNSPAARRYRFCLGQVYLLTQRYKQAAATFDEVTPDHPDYFKARYYRCLAWSEELRRQEHPDLAAVLAELSRLQTDLKNAPLNIDPNDKSSAGSLLGETALLQAELYLASTPVRSKEALAILNAITTEGYKKDDALRERAAGLYIRTYLADASYAQANRHLLQLFSAGVTDPWLINLSLSLLERQQPALLTQHAAGTLESIPAEWLPSGIQLAQTLITLFDKDGPAAERNDAEQKKQARRYELEMSCLEAVVKSAAEDRLAAIQQNIQEMLTKNPFDRSLWLARCRALLAMANKDYSQARHFWSRIRAATSDSSADPAACYYWWEARLLSLECLRQENQADQAAHVLDVTLHGDYCPPEAWRASLERLKDELGVTPDQPEKK